MVVEPRKKIKGIVIFLFPFPPSLEKKNKILLETHRHRTWNGIGNQIEKVQRLATKLIPDSENMNYENGQKELSLTVLECRIVRGDNRNF